MFTLTLTELPDDIGKFIVDPESLDPTTMALADGPCLTAIEGLGLPKFIPPPPFEHFRHNFRDLPAQKIQQIIALITKPPRAPRSDRGRRKKPAQDTLALPGTGT